MCLLHRTYHVLTTTGKHALAPVELAAYNAQVSGSRWLHPWHYGSALAFFLKRSPALNGIHQRITRADLPREVFLSGPVAFYFAGSLYIKYSPEAPHATENPNGSKRYPFGYWLRVPSAYLGDCGL